MQLYGHRLSSSISPFSQHCKIQTNNTQLERVNQCKYIGVIIDSNLTWNQQIDSVRLKAVRNLHLLRRARYFIDKPTALTLYHTLLQSHFDYCCTIWMNGHITHLRKITNYTKPSVKDCYAVLTIGLIGKPCIIL